MNKRLEARITRLEGLRVPLATTVDRSVTIAPEEAAAAYLAMCEAGRLESFDRTGPGNLESAQRTYLEMIGQHTGRRRRV